MNKWYRLLCIITCGTAISTTLAEPRMTQAQKKNNVFNHFQCESSQSNTLWVDTCKIEQKKALNCLTRGEGSLNDCKKEKKANAKKTYILKKFNCSRLSGDTISGGKQRCKKGRKQATADCVAMDSVTSFLQCVDHIYREMGGAKSVHGLQDDNEKAQKKKEVCNVSELQENYLACKKYVWPVQARRKPCQRAVMESAAKQRCTTAQKKLIRSIVCEYQLQTMKTQYNRCRKVYCGMAGCPRSKCFNKVDNKANRLSCTKKQRRAIGFKK